MSSGQPSESSYQYNGLGDRIRQTVNGVTTNYTLDLNAGLTQVLNDGTNAYVYGLGRIAQVSTTTEYFLGDALGSVRQLVNAGGTITLGKSYTPYGEVTSTAGSGTSPFAFTGEQQDASGLTYLRSRYYASGTGRFLTRDTWGGDAYSPMSYNRWSYVQSNPINYVDPTGQRAWCPAGWNQQAIKWRVDVAEKYVSQTSDLMDTYTAAGIAIQCAGTNINRDWYNSGSGLAQISLNEANTEWGEPIYNYDFWGRPIYKKDSEGNIICKNGEPVIEIRSYGLRLRSLDGKLEKALDPNNTKDAVVLMRRRIELVLFACKGCTATDRYIAAALSQNGPGFTYVDLQTMPKLDSKEKKLHNYDPDIKMNWFLYWRRDAQDGDMVNTKTQLNRFILVVNELQRRRWIVPYLDSNTINELKNW